MLSLKQKELNIRKKLNKYEKKIKFLKILFFLYYSKLKNKPNFNTSYSFIYLLTQFRQISKNKLKLRCVLTNRNKGIVRAYSISRIKMRELMQFGILPGSKKLIW